MKKAKIILAMICICAVSSVLVAFKVVRFTSTPAFTPTTIVFLTTNGTVYYTVGNFCTTNGWYITTIPVNTTTAYYLVLSQPPIATETLKELDGPGSITRPFYLCTTKTTYLTRAI